MTEPGQIHVCYYCHRLTAQSPYVDTQGSEWPACCARGSCLERWKPLRCRCVACGRTRRRFKMAYEFRAWMSKAGTPEAEVHGPGWRCRAHRKLEKIS